MDETTELSSGEAGPPAIEYAGFRSGDAPRAPKSPTILLYCSYGLVAGSGIALILALAGARAAYLLSPLAGVLLAGPALLCARLAVRRNAARRRAAMIYMRPFQAWGAVVLSASAFVIHGLLLGNACNQFTFYERSVHFVPANLQALARTVGYYHERFLTAPATLDDIVQESCEGHWMPVLPVDQPRWEDREERPLDSSYAYHPGLYPVKQDGEIVVAFEKSPWTMREVRLFYELGHSVLFADGQVRFVSQGDLKGVLERNQKRRAELGWPVCDWSKMYP